MHVSTENKLVSGDRPAIVIVGMGAACAVGTGVEALREALRSGRDGLREITRFPVTEFRTHVAGLWPAWEGRTRAAAKGGVQATKDACSTLEMAIVAAREAWANARLAGSGIAPNRIAMTLGTCFGESFDAYSGLTEAVADALGAAGPRITVSTACSSSTSAIGVARDLLERGLADVVIAGGADVLTHEVFAGFHALGALSPGKCAPFSFPEGTTLGEGAGFVVLERADQAEKRAVPVITHVLGYGLSADAHHETSPDPSGSGLARAMRGALGDAGLVPTDIDYVNAHGTGTHANDPAEWRAIKAVLGTGADAVPVSSTKSFLGHAQGAAGVLELIATLICGEDGTIPPTLRFTTPRPGSPPDPVAGDRPRSHRVRRALDVSAAFGGANAVLAFGAGDQPRPGLLRKALEISGVSAIGPFGMSLPGGGAIPTGVVPAFRLSDTLRSADERGMDPSGRFCAAAAALALKDAGVVIKGPLRDRAGLFTGNSRTPARSEQETRRSIEVRGILGVAGNHFSRMVLNAPAGAAATLLSLRGPITALSAGPGSGLLAVVAAAEHLAYRDDADLLLAGGLDERAPGDTSDSSEGAGFSVLSRSGTFPGTTAVRLAGWGLAGPGEWSTAASRACDQSVTPAQILVASPIRGNPFASLWTGAVPEWQESAGCFRAESAGASWALALAVGRVRRGEAASVLVVAGGPAVSCAVLVAAKES